MMSETSSNSSRKRFKSNSPDEQSDLSSNDDDLIEEFRSLAREKTSKIRKKIENFVEKNENEKVSFVLRSSLNHSDLLHQGYAVLSDRPFPFHACCYLCGSTGSDLIFCQECAQVYHRSCLNDDERPSNEFWSCPNCRTCQICGFECENSSLSISCFDCRRNFHRRCLKSDENSSSNVVITRWLCPSCLKCDCGEKLRSTDENLFPSSKSVASQQTLMCVDCLNNFKDLRTKSNIKLEKCPLCQRFLSHYLTKSKPLFSLSLICQQTKTKKVELFQCRICEQHFHPECDGFSSEDVQLQSSFQLDFICSICHRNENREIHEKFREKKFEILDNFLRDVKSILIFLLSNEIRFSTIENSLKNLENFYRSIGSSIRLQSFFSDFVILIEDFLSFWPRPIEICLNRHFPFFTREKFVSTSIVSSSNDHCYASTIDSIRRRRKVFDEKMFTWTNFHRDETRRCEICRRFADETSRFVPIGLNQWTHFDCLLPLYIKTFNSNSNVFNEIRQTIELSRTKFRCEICSKFGATIQCFVKNCSTRFHRFCLEEILPNFTTICRKHSNSTSNEILTKFSSKIQLDLSNTNVEFSLNEIQISIGSLQIEHLGNFDYFLPDEFDDVEQIYPDDFRASRVFWSTKTPNEKTIFHLKIRLEQNFHRTISNSPIDTKTLRKIIATNDLSRFTSILRQALKNKKNSTTILTFFPLTSMSADELVRRFCQWKKSKLGQTKFFITSDDGFSIESDDLDAAWSNVLEEIRSARNDFKLKHLPMNNDELNGHRIFGLTKTIVKQLFQRMFSQRFASNGVEESSTHFLYLSSPSSSRQWLKKKFRRSQKTFSSRSSIYHRKSSQRRCFNWLTNPHRTLQSALDSFDYDESLSFLRKIYIEDHSTSIRLRFLSNFAKRILFVGNSTIHGCGLFTLIDLVEGQMVVEYTGEIIRQSLTDQRERENEQKGVGCYLFALDSTNVIDATYQGNQARFINHNCQPNCYAQTVESAGRKHIVIFAGTDIARGTELTYDYSFQEEDIKIPCHCGTRECRMYLN